jgi:hypothetical protein
MANIGAYIHSNYGNLTTLLRRTWSKVDDGDGPDGVYRSHIMTLPTPSKALIRPNILENKMRVTNLEIAFGVTSWSGNTSPTSFFFQYTNDTTANVNDADNDSRWVTFKSYDGWNHKSGIVNVPVDFICRQVRMVVNSSYQPTYWHSTVFRVYGEIIEPPDRFLIRDNNLLKTYNTAWETLSDEGTTIEELFKTSGMKKLDALYTEVLVNEVPYKPLDDLSNNFEVLYFTELLNESSSVTLNIDSEPQLVVAKGDIDLRTIEYINQFRFTVSEIGTSRIKYSISVDSGNSWLTYINGDFAEINSVESTSASGMDTVTINSIPTDKWNEVVSNTEKIRFAYYLELDSMGDELLVDELVLDCKMRGTWLSLVEKRDFDYTYPNKTLLKVKLFSDGDYKINYFKPIEIENNSDGQGSGYIWEEFVL